MREVSSPHQWMNMILLHYMYTHEMRFIVQSSCLGCKNVQNTDLCIYDFMIATHIFLKLFFSQVENGAENTQNSCLEFSRLIQLDVTSLAGLSMQQM